MLDKVAPADVLGLLLYTLQNINLYFTSLGKEMWLERPAAITCIDACQKMTESRSVILWMMGKQYRMRQSGGLLSRVALSKEGCAALYVWAKGAGFKLFKTKPKLHMQQEISKLVCIFLNLSWHTGIHPMVANQLFCVRGNG